MANKHHELANWGYQQMVLLCRYVNSNGKEEVSWYQTTDRPTRGRGRGLKDVQKSHCQAWRCCLSDAQIHKWDNTKNSQSLINLFLKCVNMNQYTFSVQSIFGPMYLCELFLLSINYKKIITLVSQSCMEIKVAWYWEALQWCLETEIIKWMRTLSFSRVF